MTLQDIPTRPDGRLMTAAAMLLCLMTSGRTGRAVESIPQILRTYCAGCHNNVDREAGVSLLSAATIHEGSENGPLLDKDDVNDSRLLQVLSEGASLAMPPPDEAQPTAEEQEALRQWVLKGAPLEGSIAMPQVPKITVRQPADPLLSAVRLNDDEVCVGGVNSIFRLNPASGDRAWTTKEEFGKVTRLTLSSDGRWLVAACGTPGVEGQAVILQAADGQLVRRFSGHADAVYAAVLDASGTRLATAGYDRRILIHDVETQEVLQVLSGHNGSVFDLSFDPTGQVLCSASADATVKIWNVTTGKRLDTLSQPQAEQYCIAVTPDGRRIVAAGSDNRIRVWSLVSLQSAQINPLLSSTFGHEQAITSLALSPSGDRLATAAEDGTLRVWTLQPCTQLATLSSQDSLVTSIAFLNDRQLLVTRLDGSFALQPIPEVTPKVTATVRQPIMQSAGDALAQLIEVDEAEGNDTAEDAEQVTVPVRVNGTIHRDGGPDQDCYQFSATAGQALVLEVFAASNESPLDSVVEVLDQTGTPVLRTRLQAVRDSWFTFRGKDSDTSDDFRVFYWQEMELNDFLYSDGEVVRLWHYPRGPDSGFRVYPGFGSRHTYFGTTPTAHALLAPCYVVVPRAPEESITPNGLPVFPVYYRNDDDPERKRGSDSRLFFTAPVNGLWTARVTDARGFQGADYTYQLDIRTPKPGCNVSLNTKKLQIAVGTGGELEFTADRIDGFTGPITIEGHGLPPGIAMSGPAVIEEHQLRSRASLFATTGAATPTPDQLAEIQFLATAEINGELVQKTLEGLEELTVSDSSKLIVHIDSENGVRTTADAPLQLNIRPGETIRAFVRLDRNGADGIVSFGKEDAGRSLPHGVYIANTGLNGLLLPADTNEREFFITAAPIVPPGRHRLFLKSNIEGITSLPVSLEVLPTANSGGPVATR
jgi:WD40 repeat protein